MTEFEKDRTMDVSLPTGTTYILVIDTDRYAGNFERELAGYVTGVCDLERCHGERQADEAKEAAPDMVKGLQAKSRAVRHQEYGMVTNTIRATPGRLNNGLGFNFPADDPGAAEEARRKAKDYARQYTAGQIAAAQRRIDENDFEPERDGAWTREACDRTIAGALDLIERAGENMVMPAYESVAMFFGEPLTADEMAFVRQRAEEYSRSPSGLSTKPFRVLDVRLVESTIQATEKTFTR